MKDRDYNLALLEDLLERVNEATEPYLGTVNTRMMRQEMQDLITRLLSGLFPQGVVLPGKDIGDDDHPEALYRLASIGVNPGMTSDEVTLGLNWVRVEISIQVELADGS